MLAMARITADGVVGECQRECHDAGIGVSDSGRGRFGWGTADGGGSGRGREGALNVRLAASSCSFLRCDRDSHWPGVLRLVGAGFAAVQT
jgi:hypothetical protein